MDNTTLTFLGMAALAILGVGNSLILFEIRRKTRLPWERGIYPEDLRTWRSKWRHKFRTTRLYRLWYKPKKYPEPTVQVVQKVGSGTASYYWISKGEPKETAIPKIAIIGKDNTVSIGYQDGIPYDRFIQHYEPVAVGVPVDPRQGKKVKRPYKGPALPIPHMVKFQFKDIPQGKYSEEELNQMVEEYELGKAPLKEDLEATPSEETPPPREP